MKTVYFDCETSSLKEDCDIIQLAAIAVDENWNELAIFERKLFFDVSSADPESLKLNRYDPAVWEREAIIPNQACREFATFVRPFCTIEMISKRTGSPYNVARLVAHNANFDGPRLFALFKKCDVFLAGDIRVRCTLQRALWLFDEHYMERHVPANNKLDTLCRFFGIPWEENHDALYDVRMTIALARRMVEFDGK